MCHLVTKTFRKIIYSVTGTSRTLEDCHTRRESDTVCAVHTRAVYGIYEYTGIHLIRMRINKHGT